MSAAHRRDLRQRRLDELLPAETGVHGHQEHEVDLVEHVLEPVERRRRIEHEAALAAVLANQLQRSIDVLGRFGMEADVGRARRREVRE